MKRIALATILSTALPLTAQEIVGAALDLNRVVSLSTDVRTRILAALERGDATTAEALLFRQADRKASGPLLEALGALHYFNGRYFAAAQALARSDRLAPIGEQSRLTLALACIQLGRRHWARPHLERLRREHPKNPVYPQRLAAIFYTDQRFDEAEQLALEAIERDSGFGPAHDVLGQIREATGRFEEALEAYARAQVLQEKSESGDGWPSQHRGALLRELGRLEEAEKALQQAVAFNPELAAAHYEIGLLHQDRDEPRSAIVALKRAAELAPGEAKIRYALARAYREDGDADSARRELELFRQLRRGR